MSSSEIGSTLRAGRREPVGGDASLPPPAGARRARARGGADGHAVPTLALRRPDNLLGSPSEPDPVVTSIPGAVRATLPGFDYHWVGEDVDSLLAAITQFAIGKSRLPAPEHELCAVLFTDIVGSTEHAAVLGDRRWRMVLDHHDRVISEEVTRNGGTVIKSTGDGVLATLPSADRALRAATTIHERLSGMTCRYAWRSTSAT